MKVNGNIRSTMWKPASRSQRPMISGGGRRVLPWRAGPMLGDAGDTGDRLAIAVLSALSIAGIHSAINPSVFTLLSFASKPEAQARAMKGLWIGLGASTLASGAIYYIFKDWMPAILSEVTAIALFGTGVWAVNQPPAKDVPAIQNQAQVVADQGP